MDDELQNLSPKVSSYDEKTGIKIGRDDAGQCCISSPGKQCTDITVQWVYKAFLINPKVAKTVSITKKGRGLIKPRQNSGNKGVTSLLEDSTGYPSNKVTVDP